MKIPLTRAVFPIAFLLALLPGPLAVATAEDDLPAFPGAEGFGAETPGGRGGQVIEVTTLDDAGPGSLRAACEAKGPRIVVFRTGGMIEVESPIAIHEPFLTIAGQTVPGDGITLKAATEMRLPVVHVASHDIVIRGLRIWALIGDASSGLGKDWMRVAAAKEIQRGDPWPASPIPVTIHPVDEAFELVLEQAGVTVPRRDAVDLRVIADVRNKTGSCIDDPSDVGGWPPLDPGTPPADADHDGMPDQWEKQNGLDPGNADDRNDKAPSGYTWIEDYLNSLFQP